VSLLAALQQADAGFPSGGFAFSNGIEGLAALGQRFDAAGLAGLLAGVLRHRWAGCDRVAVSRAWDCGADAAALLPIDAAIEAATLPRTLRAGSRANGAALLTAHARLGSPGAAALRAALAEGALLGHLPVLQGALWRGLGIARDAALLVSGYVTISTLATAAVRLGRVGALVAQGAVRDSLPLIEALAAVPVADDAPLIAALPWLDIACARQEFSELRLFAN
jgi:urease accessory protein